MFLLLFILDSAKQAGESTGRTVWLFCWDNWKIYSNYYQQASSFCFSLGFFLYLSLDGAFGAQEERSGVLSILPFPSAAFGSELMLSQVSLAVNVKNTVGNSSLDLQRANRAQCFPLREKYTSEVRTGMVERL